MNGPNIVEGSVNPFDEWLVGKQSAYLFPVPNDEAEKLMAAANGMWRYDRGELVALVVAGAAVVVFFVFDENPAVLWPAVAVAVVMLAVVRPFIDRRYEHHSEVLSTNPWRHRVSYMGRREKARRNREKAENE